MYLKQKFNKFFPQNFIGTASGANNSPLLGTTQKWAIDRTWPIEEVFIAVNFVVNTGGITLVTSPSTPDTFDNITTLLQHVNLSVNDGKQPRSVVDCDGIALLEYATFNGVALDHATLQVIALGQAATIAAGNYRLVYRLPIVEPWIGEPLRSRMYLPVHLYPQDPVLSLTFQNAANIYSAGNINSVSAEVLLVRRQPTAQSEAVLQKDAQRRGLTNPNGYIDFDLIETPFSIAPGIGTEQRFALPIPGSYANLMFRHYLGGATVTRKEIDNGATGTSFGNEGRWRIESGLVVDREFRWKDLQTIGEYMQNKVAIIPSSGTVTQGWIGGGIPSGQGFRYANSCYLNYLLNTLSGDNATELGSVLDCNTPANSGLKMELVGTPTNVATNASYLKVMGRRYFGNLSGWQVFA
jgi:hypothetical protein